MERLLFCLLLLLLAVSAAAVEVPEVMLDGIVDVIELDPFARIIEDPSGELDLDEAILALQQRGEPWPSEAPPSLGYRRGAAWAQVILNNSFSDDQQWLLRVENSSLDRIDLYYTDAQGFLHHEVSGDLLPFDSRALPHPRFNFRIPLQAGIEQRLYLRVQTHGLLRFPLILTTLDAHYAQQAAQLPARAFGFGVLCLICIGSLLCWPFIRERIFLWFGLFMLFVTGYAAAVDGFAFQFLWPESPALADTAPFVLINLSYLFGVLFVRDFLGLRQIHRGADRALLLLALACLLCVLIAPFVRLPMLSSIFLLILAAMLCYVTVVSFRSLTRSGMLLVVSWNIFLLGVALATAVNLGLTFLKPLQFHSFWSLFTVCVILIIAAIAGKMSELMQARRENVRLQYALETHEQTEMRLLQRERQFASMVDTRGEALVCVDDSAQVVYVSAAAAELLRLDAGRAEGVSLYRVGGLLARFSQKLADLLAFPFEEALISQPGQTLYHDFELVFPDSGEQLSLQLCILPLNYPEQALYLLVFSEQACTGAVGSAEELAQLPLPQLIDEFNSNIDRACKLGRYLLRTRPEQLHEHSALMQELSGMDRLIRELSGPVDEEVQQELEYRQLIVKLMQDCLYFWQKVTGQTVIDLAQKSRIWSVSVDDGRLRARSINRYLSMEKLPNKPRWRQVARTAYFVLSQVGHDPQARQVLESAVARLQEIVEARALS